MNWKSPINKNRRFCPNYYLVWDHDFWIGLLATCLMPSNYFMAIFMITFVTIALVSRLMITKLRSNFDHEDNVHDMMLLWIGLVIMTSIMLSAVVLKVIRKKIPIWMDPSIQEKHRLDMHTSGIHYYMDEETARRGACSYHSIANVNRMHIHKNKNWLFQCFQNVPTALQSIHSTTTTTTTHIHDDDWKSITLPHMWTLPTNHKSNNSNHKEINLAPPIYTNIRYPFNCVLPPMILPWNYNPTGVYRLELREEDWRTWNYNDYREEYALVCRGISRGAIWIYWNGVCIGFSKDDHLECEFRLPLPTDRENNVLHIVNCRYSDGSYLQDQDQWWMAGIHGSIEIVRKPSILHGSQFSDFQLVGRIKDYHLQANYYETKNECIHDQERPPVAKFQLCVTTESNINITNFTNNCKTLTVEAKLFQDVQTTSEGDCEFGALIWSSSKSVTDTTISQSHDSIQNSKVEFQAVWNNDSPRKIQPWTAETPHLYTLVLSIISENAEGEVLLYQVESCRVGFRTVDISHPAGLLTINGSPITICGINRHEHDPDTGKHVTLSSMIRDIKILKENNFNSIRTSHYPNMVEFYQLCDYFGMYVVDEANVEAHGVNPLGRLAQDTTWRNAILQRVGRMVQRDRNFPCIIAWSLGNESGQGWNFSHARNYVLQNLDSSRPIQYEGGGQLFEGAGTSRLTDIICTMYPSIPRLLKLLEYDDGQSKRPIILCEYSHAMGNSNGNVNMYWECFWDQNLPRLQGGFIWDMIDQGLRKVDPSSGKAYFAYGGDFNEPISDAQFCINGLFSPDREPHPAVEELKYLQQPVAFHVKNDTAIPNNYNIQNNCAVLNVTKDRILSSSKDGIVHLNITNRYTFHKNLNHLRWSWYITSDLFTNDDHNKGKHSEFQLSQETLNGQSHLSIDISNRIPLTTLVQQYLEGTNMYSRFWLNIRGSMLSSSSWTFKDHIVVKEQFELDLTLHLQSVISEKHVSSMSLPTKPTLKSIATNNTKFKKLFLHNYDTTIEIYGQQHQNTLDNSSKKSDKNSKNMIVKFDKETGSLIQYRNYHGTNLIHADKSGEGLNAGLNCNYTRALTDNDRGGMDLLKNITPNWMSFGLFFSHHFLATSYWYQWKRKGLSPSESPKNICTFIKVEEHNKDDSIKIIFTCKAITCIKKKAIFCHEISYRIHTDGSILVDIEVSPDRSLSRIITLPRIGVSFVLCKGLYDIQYLGRGPEENYPDRNSSAEMGIWHTNPSMMGYQYIVPSENGNRTCCSWITFTDKNGNGLCVIDSSNKARRSQKGKDRDEFALKRTQGFNFSALLHTQKELHEATHTYQLEDRKDGDSPVCVNLDHQIMGLGGDVGWYPCVYPDYRVSTKQCYDYSIKLVPMISDQDPIQTARNNFNITQDLYNIKPGQKNHLHTQNSQ